jgi:lipoyl synthase
VTKTGLILGLGKTMQEVPAAMQDLVAIPPVRYLNRRPVPPSSEGTPAGRAILPPDEFHRLNAEGEAMGIRQVKSGPLVRSSNHVD